MNLLLTHYIDIDMTTVAGQLEHAIGLGLDAAAERIAAPREDTVTTVVDRGMRVDRGVDALNGSELRLSGNGQLTELTVAVPWHSSDSGTSKLWAANRFAGAVVGSLRPVA